MSEIVVSGEEPRRNGLVNKPVEKIFLNVRKSSAYKSKGATTFQETSMLHLATLW